ncbi:uncharacterized protein MELLADRAFT_107181 [Melampsora larici-populina 98AG31]|uniref:Uncharacterized protein n=1 Tax=Melampsora larici-populina (strain 98AG31 / pathotype 3-4-7) TaxID=747676 RepID=F4RP38_MELLP|nr:uncharacterized protein MELLADRAFT_107181 [Melampsora larici-populina 98AG31]EGG05752.1 hypothetical protein MELLADRAFT_107181 [Melampsora larici-populina 98AG31]
MNRAIRTHQKGIRQYEQMSLQCGGIFRLDKEIIGFRRGDKMRVAYQSETVVEGGLITHIPFAIIDESGGTELQVSKYYRLQGVIAMDNFTARQRLFLHRESVAAVSKTTASVEALTNSVTFIGRGVVVSYNDANSGPDKGDYHVACVKHWQWDITALEWVDFTAEYLCDVDVLGKEKAALLRDGNALELTGHAISWSDWRGGWIIKYCEYANHDGYSAE